MEKGKANLLAIVAFGACALIGTGYGIYDSGVFQRSKAKASVSEMINESTQIEEAVVDEAVDTYAASASEISDLESAVEKVVNQMTLSHSDIRSLSRSELRILRNAPFARAGRYFKDDKLTEYFNKYSWYSPTTYDIDIQDLTPTDRENINLIKTYE